MLRRGHAFFGVLLGLNVALGQSSAAPEVDPRVRVLPCPLAEDILPCTCVSEENVMDLDCSHVEDEEQLDRIFMAPFPFPGFRKFTMIDNIFIKVLKSGVFGRVSFTDFEIRGSSLEQVQTLFLNSSVDTLVTLNLVSNNVSVFPFADLASFSALNTVDLRRNLLTAFTPLASSSIRYLNLGGNLITEVVSGAFSDLVELAAVDLHANLITNILPDTFSAHHNLYSVNLEQNQLSEIPTGAIQLTSKTPGILRLGNNTLTTISPNGITDIGAGEVYLENNLLEILDQVIFEPIMEEGAEIAIEGNPLTCGCEIKWLVLNYLDKVDQNASCYDGELLTDLNPGMFDVCDETAVFDKKTLSRLSDMKFRPGF